jgi:hypothetical protein
MFDDPSGEEHDGLVGKLPDDIELMRQHDQLPVMCLERSQGCDRTGSQAWIQLGKRLIGDHQRCR